MLYDLIATAQKDILLITFAAHKIHRLAEILASEASRGVRVSLVLEFGVQSRFQLSHNALKAFPVELQSKAEIFYWPIEKRELNLFGKPGKLHAKAAVIDKEALVSSANLTDDASLRNLELGVLFTGGDMPTRLREHFEHLIAAGLCAGTVEALCVAAGALRIRAILYPVSSAGMSVRNACGTCPAPFCCAHVCILFPNGKSAPCARHPLETFGSQRIIGAASATAFRARNSG